MNVHKNARSCPASRALLAKRVCEQGWSVREASEAAGMSDRRGREWLRRWRETEPMTDRSSRPHALVRFARHQRLACPENFLGRDELTAVGLSQREQELGFRGCIQFEALVLLSCENRHQRSLRQRLALKNDVTGNHFS